MSEPGHPETPPRLDEPMVLWSRVLKARSEFAFQRRAPVGSSSSIARSELLSALEAYASSLANHRRPIPYALRDELRLRRLTQ